MNIILDQTGFCTSMRATIIIIIIQPIGTYVHNVSSEPTYVPIYMPSRHRPPLEMKWLVTQFPRQPSTDSELHKHHLIASQGAQPFSQCFLHSKLTKLKVRAGGRTQVYFSSLEFPNKLARLLRPAEWIALDR